MVNGEDLFGRWYERGETVFRQGDPGDVMFLVQSGAVEIVRRGAEGESVLALIEAGGCFGEMALLDDRPRSTEAVAAQRTRLVAFTRESLLARLEKDPGVAMHLLKVLCDRIEETNRLRVHDAAGPGVASEQGPVDAAVREEPGEKGGGPMPAWEFLAGLEATERHPGGSVVFRQGDPGDSLYVVIEGVLHGYRETPGGRYQVVTLGPGDLFGEMALLSGKPRSATVETGVPASLLKVPRADFLRRVAAQPELGLALLRLLTSRLRDALADGSRPGSPRDGSPGSALPVKREGRIRIGIVTLSSCAGCSAALLEDPGLLGDLLGRASIEYTSLLMDRQELVPVDVCLVDGLVRMRRDLRALAQARARSRVLVAWGTCAAWGGIPAMANRFALEDLVAAAFAGTDDLFSRYFSGARDGLWQAYAEGPEGLLRRAGTIDEHVRVDYSVPGCPPDAAHLDALLAEMEGFAARAGKMPNVCAECPRHHGPGSPVHLRLFPLPGGNPSICLLLGGTLCSGPASRGGCSARCPKGGLPCWGCRGPSDGVLQKMFRGESFESAFLAAAARRANVAPERFGPLLSAVRVRSNIELGFARAAAVEPGRIR